MSNNNNLIVITKKDFIEYFSKPKHFWFLNDDEILKNIENTFNTIVDKEFYDLKEEEAFDDSLVNLLDEIQQNYINNLYKISNKEKQISLIEILNNESNQYIKNYGIIYNDIVQKLFIFLQNTFNIPNDKIFDHFKYKIFSNETATSKLLDLINKNNDDFIVKFPSLIFNNTLLSPTSIIRKNNEIYIIEFKPTFSSKKEHVLDFLFFNENIKNSNLFTIDQYLLCLIKKSFNKIFEVEFILTDAINTSNSPSLPNKLKEHLKHPKYNKVNKTLYVLAAKNLWNDLDSILFQIQGFFAGLNSSFNIHSLDDSCARKSSSLPILINSIFSKNIESFWTNFIKERYGEKEQQLFKLNVENDVKTKDHLFIEIQSMLQHNEISFLKNTQWTENNIKILPSFNDIMDILKKAKKNFSIKTQFQKDYSFDSFISNNSLKKRNNDLVKLYLKNIYPDLNFSGTVKKLSSILKQFKNLKSFDDKSFYLKKIFCNGKVFNPNFPFWINPKAKKEYEKLKTKKIKIYYDFESICLPYSAMDNTFPYTHVVTQLSIIRCDNSKSEFEKFEKCENIVYDPRKMTILNFKELIDKIYVKDYLAPYYIVFNKGFENSRLKEMACLINEDSYYKKVETIIKNTYDLVDFFRYKYSPNTGEYSLIISNELKGYHSIKKILKIIPNFILKKALAVDYNSLEKIQNGAICQSTTIKRFIKKIITENDEKEWKEDVERMKKYCENDVRSMIAVEYFIEYLLNQNDIFNTK